MLSVEGLGVARKAAWKLSSVYLYQVAAKLVPNGCHVTNKYITKVAPISMSLFDQSIIIS